MPTEGVCAACVEGRDLPVRGSLSARVGLVSAASVVGMVAGALVVMAVSGLLGLPAGVAVLCMLGAEIACGGLAARAADKRVDRWLEARARAAARRRLPSARVVPRRWVHRPSESAERR